MTITPPKVRSGVSKANRTADIQNKAARPHFVPSRRIEHWPMRTDLVDPVVAFGVFGDPSPEGSHDPMRNGTTGKLYVKHSSEGYHPWRDAIARASHQVTRTTGWSAINEPVVVGVTLSMPHSAASKKRGDTFHVTTPDLDKLLRAVVDGLSPKPVKAADFKHMPTAVAKRARQQVMEQHRKLSVLHDDDLIVGFSHVVKVYEGEMPDALSSPGALIELWRARDLLDPIGRGALARVTALDAMGMCEPDAGWPAVLAEAAAARTPPEGPVVIGATMDHRSALIVASAMLLGGPSTPLALATAA
ncbi:hypothetical protein GCM10025867_47110 (plasmid) [Frondihabitans sucicola]|uniref:Uncharacterized protein n=1 Tax=Frondihabitans sucicola TaxID=1268041 RepID=A0ABN6Y973_9MICO|nr:hypothetical protein [Frondihabitans sucicola]BDZ52470.1 hypothetical protein GCM10025867_47110 [Frondihabitans sucicola]